MIRETCIVLLSGLSLLMGCATRGPEAPPTDSKTPLTVAVKAGPAADVPVIKSSTGAVWLEVKTRRIGRESLRQRVRVNEDVAAPSRVHVKVELDDIPIKIPTRLIEHDIWEIELPPNVLQLLSKRPATAKYTGTLEVASSVKLPLTLVLGSPRSDGRSKAKSAG
ncbi:MAG: hypothetical protein NDJ89_12660 [Oligoflexia bacterium]|nr:hypothetical protein [Oligoflexia bacterium]